VTWKKANPPKNPDHILHMVLSGVVLRRAKQLSHSFSNIILHHAMGGGRQNSKPTSHAFMYYTGTKSTLLAGHAVWCTVKIALSDSFRRYHKCQNGRWEGGANPDPKHNGYDVICRSGIKTHSNNNHAVLCCADEVYKRIPSHRMPWDL
jgi:hypothetical protein